MPCTSDPWHSRIAGSILKAKRLKAVVGVRIAESWTGNKHGDKPRHIRFTQPAPDKIAPMIRVTGEFDRSDTVGEGEALTDCRIVTNWE
jgi:hypothetical protein